MNIRPKGRNVVVRKIERSERKSLGGIVLPNTTKDGAERAEVIAVGPGLVCEETGKRINPDVSVGEIVLVPLFAMQDRAQIECGGEKLFIIPAPEILANVEEENAAPEPKSLCGSMTTGCA